jgi:hypothetical protein
MGRSVQVVLALPATDEDQAAGVVHRQFWVDIESEPDADLWIKRIADALGLPAYCGSSLEGFRDCFGDMQEGLAGSYAIHILGGDRAMERDQLWFWTMVWHVADIIGSERRVAWRLVVHGHWWNLVAPSQAP